MNTEHLHDTLFVVWSLLHVLFLLDTVAGDREGIKNW